MNKKFWKSGLLFSMLLMSPAFASDEDLLDLPPLPGDEFDLPPLPGDEATPVPKAPPPPPPSTSGDELLDLPPLPGEEEQSPEPPPPPPHAEEEPLAPLPEHEVLLDSHEEAVVEEAVEPRHHEEPPKKAVKKKAAKAKKAERAHAVAPPPAPVRKSVSKGPRTLPLPGMDFWNAGLFGPLAPTGEKPILVYLLLSFVLPLGTTGKVTGFIAALLSRLKRKT